MNEVDMQQLRMAVEAQYHASAQLREVVSISETFEERPVWQGTVHIFTLEYHPEASVCYAWSSPVEGSNRRRFYAVLGVPPINSAADAVRAAIVADRKRTGERNGG